MDDSGAVAWVLGILITLFLTGGTIMLAHLRSEGHPVGKEKTKNLEDSTTLIFKKLSTIETKQGSMAVEQGAQHEILKSIKEKVDKL